MMGKSALVFDWYLVLFGTLRYWGQGEKSWISAALIQSQYCNTV